MKKAVIYPGRFQPMLPHHEIVYKKLQAEFPDADVYIATSDKVEGSKSPFNFKEKAEIMSQMFDIPVDKIILAPQPYLIDSYKTKLDMENTMVIFAVGEKDTDRFPMNNVDEKTGLDMTVRGETRPKYYQMINTLKQHPALPMSERGYIHIAPTVKGGDEVASASAFRKAFTSVEDVEKRKDIFQQYLGSYNEKVFKLFNNKLIGEQMSEMIDVMKYLAGLSEAAPVQYGDLDVDTGMTDGDEDEYATKPGYEQDSMINQLGKVIDSEEAGKDAEDMKIKNFKPVTSVKTDDGKAVKVSPEQAKALKKMMDMLPSNRGGEEQSPREKFLDAIQNSEGLENMLDFAKSKGLVKETSELPQVDLSDIKSDYGIEEEVQLDENKLKDIIIDAMSMSEKEFDAIYKGSFDWDEINRTYNEEHPGYEHQQEPDFEESAPFGEPSQEDQMYQDMMDAYEKGGEEELAKEMKMSMEELDDELNDISLETGLHMDDDRDEIIQRYVEDVVSNADFKDHGEMDYDREMQEMRKLAGLPETVRSMDDMSDEEKEEFERLSKIPGSGVGSPLKVAGDGVRMAYDKIKFPGKDEMEKGVKTFGKGLGKAGSAALKGLKGFGGKVVKFAKGELEAMLKDRETKGRKLISYAPKDWEGWKDIKDKQNARR